MAERKLRARARADWEAALRLTVRNSTATGWTLREQRGMAWLEVRQQGHPRQSVQLTFAWSRNDVGAIVARVRNIYVLTLDGMDLAAAAHTRPAAGNAVLPAVSAPGHPVQRGGSVNPLGAGG